MLVLKKQESLVIQSTVQLAIFGMCIWISPKIAQALGGFLFPFSPWNGVVGWITYFVIYVYAFLFWILFFVVQYASWILPVVWLGYHIDVAKRRRKLVVKGFRKTFLFHTRELIKSWNGSSFGEDQTKAFLNIVHLARNSRIRVDELQKWFKWGSRQVRVSPFNVEVVYGDFSAGSDAALPTVVSASGPADRGFKI